MPFRSPKPSAASSRTMQRFAFLTSVALVTCLLLSGCVATPDELDKTTMIAGITSDVETVNELFNSFSFNGAMIRELFISLVDEQPDFQDGPLTFTPRLATEWEFSDDRLQLTFKLRDDVVWSDGVPITAEDVRFTWQAQTSPEVAYAYGFVKETIRDVEVVDPHTVRFHFTKRSATQFVDAVDGVIFPKHIWSELPFSEWRERQDWFVDNLITSGPYTFANWKRSESFELRANPLYYEEGLPKIKRILFRHIRETSSLFSQLLSGELDYIQTMRPADIEAAKKRDDLKVLTHSQRQYTFVSWNVERPYFSTPALRRALTLGINRKAIVDTIWFGYANPGISSILSTTWAAHPDLEPHPYDPEASARLFEQEGWIDTNGNGIRDKDGVEFSFELFTNTGNPLRWDAIQMIQADLGKLGIEVEPARMEILTMNSRTLAHDFDAAISAFNIDTTLDNSYAYKSGEDYNFGQYSNEEMDQLLDRYSASEDKLADLPTLHRIQEVLQDEQPITVLWEPMGIRGMSAGLMNATPSSSSDLWLLRYWEWADD